MTIQALGPGGELVLETDSGGIGRSAGHRGPGLGGGRWSNRKLVSVLVLVMMVSTGAASWWVIDRGGHPAAQQGLPPGHPVVTSLDGADLNGVPNDELAGIVEAHPDAVDTRLLLVERYLDAAAKETTDGARQVQLRKATFQAEEAERRATAPADHARAVRDLGWADAHLGDPSTGVGLLQQSLLEQPGNPDGLWYLAVVQFRVLGHPADAITTLDQLIASPAATAAQKQRAQMELTQARAAA